MLTAEGLLSPDQPVLPEDSQTVIVVTDLDGTLLDHHDYSFAAASRALELLDRKGIPLILNSSKTAAEMLSLRVTLDNHHPFVTENGGGIVTGDGAGTSTQSLVPGGNRRAFLGSLHGLREQFGYGFIGFDDMTVSGLQEATGLDTASAVAALKRDFTEPLLWQDTPERLEAFREQVQNLGLRLVKGGRFHHVSVATDKGRAIPWLRQHYAALTGKQVYVIALGDGDNDVAMLEAADAAVVIRSPVNALPAVNNPNCFIPDEPGPAGWNTAVLALCGD